MMSHCSEPSTPQKNWSLWWSAHSSPFSLCCQHWSFPQQGLWLELLHWSWSFSSEMSKHCKKWRIGKLVRHPSIYFRFLEQHKREKVMSKLTLVVKLWCGSWSRFTVVWYGRDFVCFWIQRNQRIRWKECGWLKRRCYDLVILWLAFLLGCRTTNSWKEVFVWF